MGEQSCYMQDPMQDLGPLLDIPKKWELTLIVCEKSALNEDIVVVVLPSAFKQCTTIYTINGCHIEAATLPSIAH